MRLTASAVGLTLLGVLVASCGGGSSAPSASVSGKPTGASPSSVGLRPSQRRALAARYLALASPANARLDAAVDGFHDHERRDLAAAAADLKEQASVERLFDQNLLKVEFPVQIEMVATTLVRANQARADLALEAARAPTLLALASFDPARAASDARVEQQVNVIRRQLGLPPANKG